MVKELTATSKVKYNDLKSGDKVMLNYSAAYKYEMPHKGPFVITQCVDQWHGKFTVCSEKYYV